MSVDINNRLQTLSVVLPEERQAGVTVESVAELVDKLKNEAKGTIMNILVIAEHDNNELKSSTLNTTRFLCP